MAKITIGTELIMEICILYTNDTHSYLDDFARRAHLIQKIRSEYKHTLLFDAGDSVSGSSYYNLYQGAKEAELMSLLNYDAITLGNHDFDQGSPGVAHFLKHLSVPIISSNIDFTCDPLLPKLPEYMIKGDIGIFALTTLETLDNASPSPETVINNPIDAAKKIMNEFQVLGVKHTILLSHLGKPTDERLAATIPGIDIIVGGHTHDVLYDPVKVNDTLILQAGCHGKYLGQLVIDLETKKYINSIHLLDDTLPEAPEFIPLIKAIQQERDEYFSQIVATSATTLDGDRQQQKSGETNLGNLVLDAYFHKAQQLGFYPDAAILNGLGIRTSLSAGPITKGDIMKITPYSKSLLILSCTGAQLKEALIHGLYPHISQLTVTFRLKEDGTKELLEASLKGKPLQDDGIYRVATNDFCGMGKDGYHHGFENATIIAQNLALDVDLISEYLESLPQPFTYKTDARLTYIK